MVIIAMKELRRILKIFSLVRKGGIIAFHDIIPDYYTKYGIKTGTWAGEVYKFWNEIKGKYEHLEIIKDRNQDAYGIGVLFVKY